MSAVLIVDDSLTVRMDLDEAFAAAGFEPTICADVATARQALAARRFSVVILDVLLPDGDGLELLQDIKRSPQHSGTPVVLLSTEADVQDRIRGLQTGADEYVGKPYDAGYVVARARAAASRSDPGTAAEAKRMSVLVVDDSVTAREELRSVLEREGLEVVVASSGEEGLRVASDRRPSAVIVDGVMPGMDGAAFVRQLRLDAVLRTTPCILLTASGSAGELPALEAGADAYVRKDAGNAVIVARIQALLRSSSPASALGTAGMLTPKRILAIAAREGALRDVTVRLRQDGHEIVVASSPAEALELLHLDRVDGILVDASASISSALDACRRIKSDSARRDVPLLLIEGPDEHDLMVQAINAGADDYVSEGSDPEVLRARVRAQVRRKQFEEENRAREAYARNAGILETISDAFFAVDRAWRFVYVNHAFESILGAPRQALVAEGLWERCAWLAAASFQQELRRAAEQQSPVTFDAQGPGERWFEVRAFPHQEGLSAYLRDVTERRRSQEVQAHLVGIVGHDLRTPLTAMAASAEMVLRDRSLPGKHRRALERVSGGAARMSRLISDLLDYSRARLGHGLPVSPRPAELDAICREAIEEVEAAQPGRNIEYHHEGDGTGEWDPDRIQQVLMNLLTNALRYGAGTTRVALTWKGDPDRKVISVHNEGPPIDPRLLEHIFEPFKRADALGNSWGGVGLGLYIVREIVRAHGGSVSVRSEEGIGTTFAVTLPTRTRARARLPER